MGTPWAKMTEEQKEKHLAYQRAWRCANHQRVLEARRKRHAKNREKENARILAWKRANREKVKAGRRARYAANREKVKANHRNSRLENLLSEFTLAAMAISNELQNQMKAKGTV